VYGDLKEADGLEGFIECDISSWEAQLAMFKQAVEQLGRLDVVIANAGIGGHEDFNEFEDGKHTTIRCYALHSSVMKDIFDDDH
jgi:NAD(P)-dependent dehydrogenase (short-subunit alcohol dehydrogenase family)